MGSILVGGLSYKDQSFHQELHYQQQLYLPELLASAAEPGALIEKPGSASCKNCFNRRGHSGSFAQWKVWRKRCVCKDVEGARVACNCDKSFSTDTAQTMQKFIVEAQYSLLLENLSLRFVDGDHLRLPVDAELIFEETDFEHDFGHLVFCSSPKSPELPSTGGITLPIQDE